MKNLFIILLLFILVSFTDIDIKGFNVKLDKCNRLYIKTKLNENELVKEIKINKQNDKNIYLYRKTEHLPLNFWVYLPEGSYIMRTTILLKSGKVIKDIKEFKILKHE